MITIFILIYLISLVIHLVLCHKENKYVIYNVGDLIDLIEFYMWCPVINTINVLAIVIGFVIVTIWELSKLNVLWEKFRSIKLK